MVSVISSAGEQDGDMQDLFVERMVGSITQTSNRFEIDF